MADVAENLNTLAKEVFADGGVPDLIPNGLKLQEDVKFKQSELLGLKYVQVVRLAYPSGFTHALGDGTAGAFALNAAQGGAQGRAEIQGVQMLLKDQMSYEDAAKCTGSKQAFIAGTDYLFEGMQMAAKKRNEVEMFVGAQGLGTISGTPSTSGSNKVVTITTSKYAPGIWLGNTKMALDCYNGSSKINSNADLVLEAVDTVNRTITVSGNATDLGNLANGYTLFYKGAKGNEGNGIHGILNNTGSLFNIDAAVYNLWQSTAYAPISGALSFQKLKKAIAQSVGKGLDEDCTLYVSPGAWSDLADSIESLRRTSDKEVRKTEVGTQEIVYHSQNGLTTVKSSLYVWEGFAYGIVPKLWKRVGARDITMKMPGFAQTFFHLPSNAGIEARIYSNQTPFCYMPAKQFVISNIVNTVV